MNRTSCLFVALILTVTLSALTITVAADNAIFKIEPQQKRVVTLSLQETDSVSGSFSVVSEDESGINFFVKDPQNGTVLGYLSVGQKKFSFTANMTGDYKLYFDNTVSSVYVKTVALNYNITHYIMGLPQEQFLLVVIAVVALIGIIIYVALMPK